MALVVQKFGGTSVGTPERMRAVARRVAGARARGDRVAVVVSAMGDTTDQLLELAAAVAPGAAAVHRRELDQLLATGEQAAAALLALALEEEGIPAVSLTGAQAGIRTDGVHGSARIRSIGAERVRSALAEGRVPVVAGYQGLSDEGAVTTLGRGGSDTTGVALAVAIGADRCDIFTDVDGIYSADPRRVVTAYRYERLSHREALQLALAGAGVLHPRAASLAASHCLPLRVLSSMKSGPEEGTVIEGEHTMEGPRVLGVAATTGVVRLVAEEPGSSVALVAASLRALAEAGVPVDHFDERRAGDGGRRFVALVPQAYAAEAARAVAGALGASARVALEEPVARVTVVGTGLSAHSAGIASALQRLGQAGIEPEGLGITELGLTLYVEPGAADRAVALLHDALVEPPVRVASRSVRKRSPRRAPVARAAASGRSA
jgi:aspartate kinase